MGAFEFDLSARNCDCNSNNNSSSNGSACIIAQKIFDQCRIQKCLTSDMLGPARAAKGNGNSCNDMLCEGDIIIPPCNAADVSIRDLELERIEILRKKPNPLQEGCWDLELKYVFNYTLEFRRTDGCFIGCIPATNSYNLRVTLFGSTEADVTTATDLYDCCGNSNGGPFAIAEGKAVALQADLRYPNSCASNCCDPCHPHHHHSCECNAITVSNGDAAMGAPVAVNVSIGLFTIVKLFRTINMVVNSLGRCMPETCTNTAVPGDPCRNFENIQFPLDMFSPSTEPKSCCGFGPVYGSPNCEIDCLGCGCNENNGCNNNCSCNNNGCDCGCR